MPKEEGSKDAGKVISESYDKSIWDATEEPTETQIGQDFREEQSKDSGKKRWEKTLREHNSRTPKLSGGDVDATWDQADVGEETVGGENPTPDQDVVEELGEALGVTYQDTEPLKGAEKIHERDRERWELDPASSEDYEQRTKK